jgi:hypothetical protein
MKTALIIFAYNRPQHLYKLLESLINNEEFSSMPKYIFIDGPRLQEDIDKIARSQQVIERFKLQNIQVISSKVNMGLADSIINGVSKVLEKFESVVVLEDDLIVGRHYLKFMISSLEHYKDDLRIAQVSGFIFPIKTARTGSSLILPLTTTLGWGTWRRVWSEVDFFPTDWQKTLKDKKIRYKFDLGGTYPYSKMLKRQMDNPRFGSWGIRFWWDIFKKGQYVVYPDYPMVQHRDFDGSGTHKSDYSHLDMFDWNVGYSITSFEKDVSNEVFSNLRVYLKQKYNPFYRFFLYLKRTKIF